MSAPTCVDGNGPIHDKRYANLVVLTMPRYLKIRLSGRLKYSASANSLM